MIEPNIVQAIGVMAFAYVCHHNIFLVYESLKNSTEARMATATHWSIGASCLLMLIVGIAGYLPFGAATQANVLVSCKHLFTGEECVAFNLLARVESLNMYLLVHQDL